MSCGVIGTVVTVTPSGSSGTIDYSSVLPRLICHALVNRIPDGGLGEMYETLSEIFAFYSARANPVALSPPKTVVGRVVRSMESPPFAFDE